MFERSDVFGFDDVDDVGTGEPLFSRFTADDWALLNIRVELHLLAHSFTKDAGDDDRIGMHVNHLGFYYNKYFKKPMAVKSNDIEDIKDFLYRVRDTVRLYPKNQVLEPLLPAELDTFNVFVMLT